MRPLLVFLAVWVCLGGLLWPGLARLHRWANTGRFTPSDSGWVVVVSSSTGREGWLVLLDDLQHVSREHPDYTFLIPEGLEVTHELRYESPGLDEPKRLYKVARFGIRVRVLERSSGRQYLEVSRIATDSRRYLWYEATATDVQPRWVYDDYTLLPQRVLVFVFYIAIPITLRAQVRRLLTRKSAAQR